jgi:hypothetical protein
MIELISDSELEDAFSDVRPERMDIGKGESYRPQRISLQDSPGGSCSMMPAEKIPIQPFIQHTLPEKKHTLVQVRARSVSAVYNQMSTWVLSRPLRKFVDCLQEETVVKELVEKKRSVEEDE